MQRKTCGCLRECVCASLEWRSCMNDLLEKSNPTQAEYFKDIVGTIREPLLVLDKDLRILAANRSFYKFFKMKAGETIGQLIYDIGNSQWDIPGLRLLLETILPQKTEFHDYHMEHDFSGIGRCTLLLNARRISRLHNKAAWILLAFEDVTERIELERMLQASEDRFRRAFETAQDGMLLIEKKGGQILNSNQSAEAMLGYSKRSLLKKNLWELGILKDEGQFRQTSLDLEDQGVVDLVDKSIPTRGGRNIPADVYLMDRAAVIQCNIRDISARKRKEGAIHDLARFPTENPNTVMRIDRGGNLLYANEAALVQLAGWKMEPGNQVPKVLNDPIREVIETGTAQTVELTCGERIFSIAIELTKTGKEVDVYGHDITEHKQAEQKLEQERILLRTLIDNLPDRIYVMDANGRKIISNMADWQASGGKKMEDILGKTDLETYPPELAQDFWAIDKSVIDSGNPIINREETGLDSQGKPVSILSTKVPLRDGQGKIIGLVGTGRDITERNRAEEALRKSEEKFRNLFNNAEVGMFRSRLDGSEILDMNEKFLTIFGRTRAEMQGSASVLHWADLREREELARQLETAGCVIDFECGLLNKQGQVRRCLTSMRLYQVEGILEGSILDITERKRNELVQDAIYRITQAAITSKGIDELYHSIRSILGELISVKNFYIALYDPLNQLISFPYFVDQYDQQPSAPTKLQGPTGYVIRTGRPLLASREIFDQLVEQGEFKPVGTVGVDWMGAPLKVEGRMIGVMTVKSYSEKIRFSQEDLNLLEFVSTQVAQAIERKRMEHEIRNLSLTDALTGLYNRRGFTLLAEQELKLAHRKKRSMLLFFGDVDNLKTINDTQGHAQGDLALQEISACLKGTFREADILARFGGDEFVVLAVDASMERADILADRIQATLKSCKKPGDRPYHLSFSLGLAHYDPEAPCTVSEMIAQADGRMYQQKQARKAMTRPLNRKMEN